jgi:hypothetical protein
LTFSPSQRATFGNVHKKIKIAVAGALGASAAILFVSFYQETMSRWSTSQYVVFFVVTAFVAWLTWQFFEPFFRRALLGAQDQAHEPRHRGVQYLRHFAAVLATAVMMTFFLQGLTMRQGGGFLILLFSMPVYGLITYAWMAGAINQPKRAGRWGGIAGVVGGAVTLGSLGLFVGVETVFPTLPPDPDIPRGPGPLAVFLLAGTGAMTMGLRGLVGGKAIEWLTPLRIGFRVIIGIAATALLGVVQAMALGLPDNHAVHFAAAVGWGVGLIIYPPDQFIEQSIRPGGS